MARGSKRKRGDAWQLRVYVGGGRYVSKTFRGSEREADRALRRMLDQHDSPGRRTPTDLTVAEWCDRWCDTREADGLAAETLRGYRAKIRTHIAPTIGAIPLDRVTVDDIERVLRLMTDRGLSVASRRQTYAVMRRALEDAALRGHLSSNPAQLVRAPTVRWTPPDIPDSRQVGKILAAADEHSPTAGVLVRLAIATGARRGELLALHWSDIRQNAVYIGRAISRDRHSRLVEKPTKTHAQAEVDIDPHTAETVEAHRLRMVERCLAVGDPLGRDRYVFSGDPACRLPFDPGWASKTWHAVRDGAGVDMPFKDLRHLSASYLLEQGIPAHEVAARLRHASPQTTLRYYAARTSTVREQTRSALSDLIGGAPERGARPAAGR